MDGYLLNLGTNGDTKGNDCVVCASTITGISVRPKNPTKTADLTQLIIFVINY